jgi:dolichol kinase
MTQKRTTLVERTYDLCMQSYSKGGHSSRAAWALTVFALSDAVIVGSNPIQGMDAWCVYAFIMCLCLGSGLATGWSLAQGVLPYVKNDYGTE